MIVFAHLNYFVCVFAGRFWNRLNGGVRSSKIKVDFWFSEFFNASSCN